VTCGWWHLWGGPEMNFGVAFGPGSHPWSKGRPRATPKVVPATPLTPILFLFFLKKKKISFFFSIFFLVFFK